VGAFCFKPEPKNTSILSLSKDAKAAFGKFSYQSGNRTPNKDTSEYFCLDIIREKRYYNKSGH